LSGGKKTAELHTDFKIFRIWDGKRRYSESTPQAKGQGNSCVYVMMIAMRIIGLSFSFQVKKNEKE